MLGPMAVAFLGALGQGATLKSSLRKRDLVRQKKTVNQNREFPIIKSIQIYINRG